VPAHTLDAVVFAVTAGAEEIVTEYVVAGLEPQLLSAVTEIFPDVLPNVTLIEVVP
jgi:hypothetical protein